MAVTPYCADLDDACRHLELKPADYAVGPPVVQATKPSAAEATLTWTGIAAWLQRKLGGAGLVIDTTESNDARTELAELEALFVSGRIGSVQDARRGKAPEKGTKHLLDQATALLADILREPWSWEDVDGVTYTDYAIECDGEFPGIDDDDGTQADWDTIWDVETDQ